MLIVMLIMLFVFIVRKCVSGKENFGKSNEENKLKIRKLKMIMLKIIKVVVCVSM